VDVSFLGVVVVVVFFFFGGRPGPFFFFGGIESIYNEVNWKIQFEENSKQKCCDGNL
jgi:hypothetical protein